MLNLLKYENQKKVIREYRGRFIISALLLLLALEVIAFVLLVPSYVISLARVKSLSAQTARTGANNAVEESAKLNAVLADTNQLLAIVSSDSLPPHAGKAVTDLLESRLSGIRIVGVVYKAQGGGRSMVLQGSASTREKLLAFQKSVQAAPGVVSVDLPISNFTQSENIQFSMTVSLSN